MSDRPSPQRPTAARKTSWVTKTSRAGLGPVFDRISRVLDPVRGLSKFRRALVISAMITVILAGLMTGTRIIDRLEHWLGDWRFSFAGERLAGPHPDVTLVLIREESLLDSPAYSPMDRRLLADLVTRIDAFEPRVIGLDFVFDKRTPQDQELFDAITAARAPIVLGVIEDRTERGDLLLPQQVATQRAFLDETGAPYGYFNITTDFDDVVRRRAPPREGGAEVSFADLLANPYNPTSSGDARIDWLAEPSSGGPPFTTVWADQLDVILNREAAARRVFENRVVVIGAGLRVMLDYHQTPLDKGDGDQTYGAEVIAQMVAQRLDGRTLNEFSLAGALGAAALMAFVGAFGALTFGRTWYDAVAALILLFAVDLMVFEMFDMVAPIGALLASWAAAAVLAEAVASDPPPAAPVTAT